MRRVRPRMRCVPVRKGLYWIRRLVQTARGSLWLQNGLLALALVVPFAARRRLIPPIGAVVGVVATTVQQKWIRAHNWLSRIGKRTNSGYEIEIIIPAPEIAVITH